MAQRRRAQPSAAPATAARPADPLRLPARPPCRGWGWGWREQGNPILSAKMAHRRLLVIAVLAHAPTAAVAEPVEREGERERIGIWLPAQPDLWPGAAGAAPGEAQRERTARAHPPLAAAPAAGERHGRGAGVRPPCGLVGAWPPPHMGGGCEGSRSPFPTGPTVSTRGGGGSLSITSRRYSCRAGVLASTYKAKSKWLEATHLVASNPP